MVACSLEALTKTTSPRDFDCDHHLWRQVALPPCLGERVGTGDARVATTTRSTAMPLAKIYVNEGQYDEARLTEISGAVQAALRGTLGVPPDDFFQLIFEMPRNRYLHTASFVGMEYTDDLVTLEIFFSGRSTETRLALLKDLDTRIAAAAGISPDDVFINLVETPGENISFGQGEAQRANAVE
jgi:hypothetical protein